MKKIIFKIAFIFFVLLIVSNSDSYAQKTFKLGHFGAVESNGTVILTWLLEKGNTCNGISIYRSSDNINFTKIGSVFGICGSISEPLNYSYTDNKPENNTTNYYRLKFGIWEDSEVLAVEVINIKNDGYSIQPNPIKDFGKIYYNNTNNKPYHLTIYQLNGAKVFEEISDEEYFDINLSHIPEGVFVFTISREDGYLQTSGKLLVKR